MRIAIIGATGMLGHHTALAALAAGHELLVIHRASSRLVRLDGLEFSAAVADLTDRGQLAKALANVDGVINCAAPYPSIPLHWRMEVDRSVEAMDAFYDACADAAVGRIVYLGGSIVLSRRADSVPATEADAQVTPPADKNPYVQAKWAMDDQAIRRARGGLPVIVGIPSMTFGEYDWGPSTGQLIVGIAGGTLTRYVDGRRNTIYAGDAGRGLIRVLEDGRFGERYLLTGENVTMADVAARVAAKAGVPLPKAVPLSAAKLTSLVQHGIWRLGSSLPQLSKTAIAVLSGGQFLDGSKAASELGFESNVSLDQALDRALSWFRSNGYC